MTGPTLVLVAHGTRDSAGSETTNALARLRAAFGTPAMVTTVVKRGCRLAVDHD